MEFGAEVWNLRHGIESAPVELGSKVCTLDKLLWNLWLA